MASPVRCRWTRFAAFLRFCHRVLAPRFLLGNSSNPAGLRSQPAQAIRLPPPSLSPAAPRWASPACRSQRGIALLLTLGILLLLTLLALSFSSSQLTENQAARNFYHAARAEEIALGGLETALAVLKDDAFNNSSDHLFERWAMYYQKDDGFAGDEPGDVDLSDYDELEHGVDGAGDRKPNIFHERIDPWDEEKTQEKLDSRWISFKARNAITGKEYLVWRFAVCIEDENAKVNINTAGNPDPEQKLKWEHRQNMGFTTAEIDLGAIFENLGTLFSNVLEEGVTHYPNNVGLETALDIVRCRYGWASSGSGDTKGVPGKEGDDNSTSSVPPPLRQNMNAIDDDGDGRIDELGEEADEPGEFDPYDPMQLSAPGELSGSSPPAPGTTGIVGNDTPYLTLSQLKMTKSVSRPGSESFPEKEYEARPKDMLYRALLPYVTVYSQDLNRLSNRDWGTSDRRTGTQWMMRENMAGWLGGVPEIKRFLEDMGIPYQGEQTHDRAIRQIAVNIKDFIDPDWFPTKYVDVVGIEPTAYLNEIEPNPPLLPGPVVGLPKEVVLDDHGEFIELWNPYDVPLDIANYYVTIDSSSPKQVGPMAVSSTVVPPGGFFVIGDTLGDIYRTGQETLKDQVLPPYPLGCQAYAPINLDPPFVDIFLEMRPPGRGAIPIEVHYPVPFAPPGDVTLQKDDPRVSWDWKVGPPTPGRMNATMSNRDPAQTYFYVPGMASRRDDPSFNPSEVNSLDRAGALSSIGELGMVHRADRWRTLNFTGESQYGYPEDVMLLDLLTFPYQYRWSGPNPMPAREFVPGRININTAPPEILLGLNWENMFEDLESYGIVVGSRLRLDIIEHLIKNRPYRSLADVARAMAKFPPFDNEAAKEVFLRYNANLITTKSNVFKVTVLAEVFDRKGNVAASRKLEAVVDRGFTPGGTVREPGDLTEDPAAKGKPEATRVLYFRWVTED